MATLRHYQPVREARYLLMALVTARGTETDKRLSGRMDAARTARIDRALVGARRRFVRRLATYRAAS